RVMPAGEGWVGLRSAPDGTVFGRRAGEGSVRLVSPASPMGSAGAPTGVARAPPLPAHGKHNRKRRQTRVLMLCGQRIDRAAAIWFFPWQGAERKIAEVPLAWGNIAVAPSGDVLVSSGTSVDMDLAMLELKPVS